MKKRKAFSLFFSSLVLFMLISSLCVFGFNSAGNLEQKGNINIEVNKGLFASLFGGLFDVFPGQGTYEPGDEVRLTQQSTSWNLHCDSAFLVVEIYSPTGDNPSYVKSESVGEVDGNQYFSTESVFELSNSAPEGTWHLYQYLWCENDAPQTLGDEVDHSNKIISSDAYSSFQVVLSGDCAYDRVGYIRDSFCQNNKLVRFYVDDLDTCTGRNLIVEDCDVACADGECVDYCTAHPTADGCQDDQDTDNQDTDNQDYQDTNGSTNLILLIGAIALIGVSLWFLVVKK